jgi:exopolyphosphatase / guanosine-5'-triphosphate,3'-diphosphate pyrophosphatase
MKPLHFAAIDIGSNAVRLLIKQINPESSEEHLDKVLLVRFPLRLGEESFSTGIIGKKKEKQLVRLMKSFKHLIKVFDVVDYRVCATSAMRDAENSDEVVKTIKKETGFKIEIISGQEEATIIYESHFADTLSERLNYLYVDVGGGSTEVSLIVNNQLVDSKSYNVGTVRMLNQNVEPEVMDTLKADLIKLAKSHEINSLIGSGGNIIKLNTLAKVRKDRKMTLEQLEEVYAELNQHNVDELITQYGLKPDRADVITHAAKLFIEIANASGAKNIAVPKIGLSDGIIHMLYEDWKQKQNHFQNYYSHSDLLDEVDDDTDED